MSGNGQDQRFADRDLLDYLNGDAADETRRAIEDALPHDDDLATRLRALDRFDDVVEPAFRALLAQAPAEALADRYVAAVEESAAASPAAAKPRRRGSAWPSPSSVAPGSVATRCSHHPRRSSRKRLPNPAGLWRSPTT